MGLAGNEKREKELKQRLDSLKQTESTLHSEFLRLQSLNQSMEELKLSNMENLTRQKKFITRYGRTKIEVRTRKITIGTANC